MPQTDTMILVRQSRTGGSEYLSPAVDVDESALGAVVRFDATGNAWNDPNFIVTLEVQRWDPDVQVWQVLNTMDTGHGALGKDGLLPSLSLTDLVGKRVRCRVTSNATKTFGLKLSVVTP